MAGAAQPEDSVQTQLSMWSVWYCWERTSGALGRGTGRGEVVRVVVRREASRSPGRVIVRERVVGWAGSMV